MQTPTRSLFVDGYNVLHAWRWLTADRADPAELGAVRARLAEAVRTIHDVEGLAVTIVFDGREHAAARDEAESSSACAVVFAPAGLTADGVIERLVAGANDPHACVVATADRLVRETVSAAGGTCVSPDELRAWTERCRERAARHARTRASRQQKSFSNKLPL